MDLNTEWQKEFDEYAKSLISKNITKSEVPKVKEIDQQIVDFSNTMYKNMQWDKHGNNQKMSKFEILTLMGMLDKQHDELLVKLSKLIEAVN